MIWFPFIQRSSMNLCKSPDSRSKNITAKNLERNRSYAHVEHRSFGFGAKNQDYNPRKAAKTLFTSGGNELSRFSDTPGDASLDDLFHPLEKSVEDRAAEASTSASSSHVNQNTSSMTNPGKNDLAKKFRAAIAQKQLESDTGKTNGGDLLRLMKFVLKEDVIDMDGLVVEFSKLVASLRPNESEDVIVSASQKLIGFFHQRPEQKIVFVTQYGLLPLMELLEVP